MNSSGQMLDPVCDMIVDVAEQRERGPITIELPNGVRVLLSRCL